MGDLLMGIMLIVELSRFIPSRIFYLQINQFLLINQLELLIEQFSQSPNWVLILQFLQSPNFDFDFDSIIYQIQTCNL
jgi:hypothetical protein